MKEYIAYQGKEFTIEWYYNSRGKSQALNYYHALSLEEKIRVLKLFKRIGDGGKIKDRTKFNFEGEQIYAFKPQPDRFLCFFFEGNKIVITNAFRKKQQKLSPQEKVKAVQYQKDYVIRAKQGNYYEQS